MNATGRKIARKTSVVAVIGPVMSFMAWTVAATESTLSRSMMYMTRSTTMIASSTTVPMTRTNANSVRMLMLKPSARSPENVAMIDTGIATTGTSVTRQSCRKR